MRDANRPTLSARELSLKVLRTVFEGDEATGRIRRPADYPVITTRVPSSKPPHPGEAKLTWEASAVKGCSGFFWRRVASLQLQNRSRRDPATERMVKSRFCIC